MIGDPLMYLGRKIDYTSRRSDMLLSQFRSTTANELDACPFEMSILSFRTLYFSLHIPLPMFTSKIETLLVIYCIVSQAKEYEQHGFQDALSSLLV